MLERYWELLSTYFHYTAPIRKIIYTTNAVEGFHRLVLKVTKTKRALTSFRGYGRMGRQS